MDMDADCPCCASPWNMTTFRTTYTHMKIVESTQKVVWIADHGQALTDIGLDQLAENLYISSGQNQTPAPERAYIRKLEVIDPFIIAWTLSAPSATDTDPRSLALRVLRSNDFLIGTISGGAAPAQPSELRKRSGADGSSIWATTLVGSNNINDIAVDSSNNIFVTRGNGGLEHYNSTGTLVWTELVLNGGSRIGVAVNDSRVASVGASGTAPGVDNIRVYDKSKTPIWTANHDAIARACAFLSDGSLVVVGDAAVTVGPQVAIRVYDGTGTELWNAEFNDGFSVLTKSGALCVAVDSDDNIYVGGGQAQTVAGRRVPNVRKYSSDGTPIWDFDYSLGRSNSGNGVNSLAIDEDGGFLYLGGN